MRSRIRLFAGMATFAGAALLVSAKPAYSTMMLDPFDDAARTRYCCAVDTDGDRRGDTWCCYSTGCSINSTGCRRTAE
jgi:hypothetical protein